MLMLKLMILLLMIMMRLITKLLLEQVLIGQAYQYCTVIIPKLFNNNARRIIFLSPRKSSKRLLQSCGYLEWLPIMNSSGVAMMTMTELSCDPILVGFVSDWHSWISCNSISTTIPPQTSAQYFFSVSSDCLQDKFQNIYLMVCHS